MGMVETGWIMSEIQRCRRVFSKRQELDGGNSLTFRDVNVETNGKTRRGIDKNLRTNAFCS